MKRFVIMLGFVMMFVYIRVQGNLNMYINTRYSYLSVLTIGILSLLCAVEFIRVFRKEREEEKRKEAAAQRSEERSRKAVETLRAEDLAGEFTTPMPPLEGYVHMHDHSDYAEGNHHQESVRHYSNEHDHGHDHGYDHKHDHGHDHAHGQTPNHGHAHDGHSHGNSTRLQRAFTYLVLCFPIYTGIFLPAQTLDSSFVKAKGFSFPSLDVSADNPGNHQFLRPDTSIFYGKEGYDKLKKKELSEFAGKDSIALTDPNYLKGMEVLYNFPGEFMGKTVSFDGFVYKGEQVEGNHYFVFRFGFIHCAADSGVFGMLVDFPKGTVLKDDDWVHVTGTLSSELYQPFKQTLPVLEVTSWQSIDAPKNPYVYRSF
ncbi:TIGR03943 family putative permease subunit [Gorillibacterium sp. sgz500922]|uniref:TIGR03943 family putative permease subunit n=1 Tax=Gorillibacterium sp. sgz500922 TaxID=3446694 RepID=UPI003F66CE6F